MGTFAINPATGLPFDMQQRLNLDGSQRRPPVLVLTSGVNAVSGGGASAGWMSGTLASMGAGATVTSVFDLGPDWDQYGMITLAISGTQAITSVTPYGSDDGVANTQPAIAANGLAAATAALAAAGVAVVSLLPSGRYVRVVTVNGATAQSAAAAVRLSAYPG